jgi:ABC-type bacteriocin/lantibiotic exporter with double-glycine peptidase domain
MVQKIKKLYQQGKSDLRILDDPRLKGALNIRAFLYSLLLTFFLSAPIILVFVNLFSLYAPGSLTFTFLSIGAGLCMLVFNGLASMFYVKLLKRYFKEIKELQSVKESGVFFVECFNVAVLLIVAGFVIFFSLS